MMFRKYYFLNVKEEYFQKFFLNYDVSLKLNDFGKNMVKFEIDVIFWVWKIKIDVYFEVYLIYYIWIFIWFMFYY